MPPISAIPAFSDNYIWLLHDNQSALLIDPGDATVAETVLTEAKLNLSAIFITHHHHDHCGGVAELLKHYHVPVYGPAHEALPFIYHAVREGDKVEIPGVSLHFKVLDIPGHTRGHIAYFTPGLVFCGDTLFTGGCGKIFEGTAKQMYQSLQKLARLPNDTAIYCGHEYTLANLHFALAVEPHNAVLQERIQKVLSLRKKGESTVPETLAIERLTNPFLRCHIPEVKAAAEAYWQKPCNTPVDTLAALRQWKDTYK